MISALIILMQEVSRPSYSLMGIIVPGVVFLVSFGLTWALYKHFSKGDSE